MCDNNKKKEGIPTPSYSMMHALEDGFSIVMYSGTRENNMTNSCVHRYHAVRLILKKEMGFMWYERLYHSGVKSRVGPSGIVKPDLRFVMYVWPYSLNNQRHITVGTTDGVAR